MLNIKIRKSENKEKSESEDKPEYPNIRQRSKEARKSEAGYAGKVAKTPGKSYALRQKRGLQLLTVSPAQKGTLI